MPFQTAKLLNVRPNIRSPFRAVLSAVTDLLVACHGVPALGNFRDPVQEIFYILLSARTTDAQYRLTYRTLRRTFRTLPELAAAPVSKIRDCIVSGGLAGKRAGQIRRTARQLAALGGSNPSRFLRSLTPKDAFEFIVQLPGMGPKSAFCVLMYSLDVDCFPVDVNVQRIAERIGAIPKGLKHYQAQRRLATVVPDGRSRDLHISMVVHGRTICLPMNPKCGQCDLRDLCRTGRRRERETNDHGEGGTQT